MDAIRASFPSLFGKGKGRNRPLCGKYRDFIERYGFTKMAFDAMQDSIAEAEKIGQLFIGDFFYYLEYMLDKADAEYAQNEYEDTLRKAQNPRKH